MIPISVKKEAIQLRQEKRLSVKVISRKLGISVGTVSVLLRPYRLTKKELSERALRNVERTQQMLRKRRVKMKKQASKFYHMAGGGNISNQKKGRIAECAIMFRLVLYGFEVYTSIFDGEKIDFVIRTKGNKLLKVQVRIVSRAGKYGCPAIRLRCSNGRKSMRRMSNSDMDFLVGYDLYSDCAFVFTKKEMMHVETSITVNEKAREAWSKLMERQ